MWLSFIRLIWFGIDYNDEMITYKNVHRNIFIVAKDQNPIKQRSTYLNKVDLFWLSVITLIA